MAVVSISRIQIRRGKEQSGSGLPQLASGELGWAIDTQNLYIGNGSVSEGAPAVGNTRIITENDNLFTLVENSYVYREGSSIGDTVSRGLQERLDDRVSVRAFGAKGDGTDVTAQLQAAIYQLFLNTNPQDKAVLHMEPGEYVISSTIYVPKNTKLVGAGIGKTTIRLNGNIVGFRTVNDNTTASSPQWSISSDSDTHLQPTGVHLSGMTLQRTSAGVTAPIMDLYNLRYGLIEDVEFLGNYGALSFSNLDINNDPIADNSAGIKISGDSKAIYSSNITVRKCKFYDLFAAVTSDDYVLNNTIQENDFYECVYGVALGANLSIDINYPFPTNTLVSNNSFDSIYASGLYAPWAVDTRSENNKFYDVGSRYSSPSSWDSLTTQDFFAVIYFNVPGNLSVDDWIERSYILTTGSSKDGNEQASLSSNIYYIPDVKGPVDYTEGFAKIISVQDTTSATPLFRLAADTLKTYTIDYVYESTIRTFKRFGKLTVTVDPSVGSQTIKIMDDYDTIGNSSYDENIEWSGSFAYNNETIVISTKNPGDAGTLQIRAHVKA